MCILTNTVIPHLSEQLSLFLSRGVLVWTIANLTLTIYWDSQGSFWSLKVYFGLYFLTLYPTHTLFLSLFSPFSPPEDTTVSGLQPGCGGFTKAMRRVGLFFPEWASEWSICPCVCSAGPALLTLLIAGVVLDSVQLTSKETRYIIVWRGTSGVPDIHWLCPVNRMLWPQASEPFSVEPKRFTRFIHEKLKAGHASQTKTCMLMFCFLNGMHQKILNYFTFAFCLLIRNLNIQSR